jgi:hypothetical protein
MLLAISNMLDTKLAPIENRITNIELILENNMLPRIQNIESCYTSTYDRYKNHVDQMQAAFDDLDIVKKVLAEHSEKLQKISRG